MYFYTDFVRISLVLTFSIWAVTTEFVTRPWGPAPVISIKMTLHGCFPWKQGWILACHNMVISCGLLVVVFMNENYLCIFIMSCIGSVFMLIYFLLGPMSAPRAGSSRGPVVADPAVATRTNQFLMQSDENKRLTVLNKWLWGFFFMECLRVVDIF